MRRIEVLDTTLRDGAQGENVVFSLEDKLKVIRCLDELGIDYIEAGNPASNPKDRELFEFALLHMRLINAKLAAFGATRRAGAKADEDEGLIALKNSGAPVISLFGKAAPFQVRNVLKCSLDENLSMIEDSIAFLTRAGLKVFFDAEHYFDGWAEDRSYALEALKTARSAGASALVLCDTNGASLPARISEATAEAALMYDIPIGIHCHNDIGLATAATLLAVEAGASQVQGTINGYGERCGNANLCEVIPNLRLKLHYDCLRKDTIHRLTGTARLTAEILNLSMSERSPYVGRSAFAHKGGMHIDGMLKNPVAFEHIDPELVGNARRFLLSEMAGRGALMTRLSSIAPELTKDSRETHAIMSMLKGLEMKGYSFEGAEGSLKLRVLGELKARASYFEVLDFHVTSSKPADENNAQAFVKVAVGAEQEITADEGDGPVNALDKALRKALTRFYPCLTLMRLKDFKVRVVDGQGTASAVRVTIESTDGAQVWSTVGVSTNIIEASFIALTDSIEYMLMNYQHSAV